MAEESDECSLAFNIFGDLLDDIEHEDLGPPKRKATQKEIDKLIEFIGGFDKWSLLNPDCRMEVIKHLDYKSRCQLGVCSKIDYAIVEKTPIHVHSVEMKDNERSHYSFSNEPFDNVVVQIQFHHDYNSGKRFELIFSQLEEDTQIQWLHYFPRRRPEKRQVIRKACNYYEEAVKFAEKWMKKCNYELKAITVEMSKYPFEISQIKALPLCTDVRFSCNNMDSFNWWFQRVPEQLKDLQLLTNFDERNVFTIPSEFLNAPQIMQVPKFYFWCRADFNDDQFLTLKAKSQSFDAVSITNEGINKFIKKWIHGEGPEDFKQVHLWGERNWDQDVLISGLTVRPWDHDFEQEALGFCEDFTRVCGRGACFQIKSLVDPLESLTLSIHGDRVSIYWTGRRVEWGGRVYTSYSIPM